MNNERIDNEVRSVMERDGMIYTGAHDEDLKLFKQIRRRQEASEKSDTKAEDGKAEEGKIKDGQSPEGDIETWEVVEDVESPPGLADSDSDGEDAGTSKTRNEHPVAEMEDRLRI